DGVLRQDEQHDGVDPDGAVDLRLDPPGFEVVDVAPVADAPPVEAPLQLLDERRIMVRVVDEDLALLDRSGRLVGVDAVEEVGQLVGGEVGIPELGGEDLSIAEATTTEECFRNASGRTTKCVDRNRGSKYVSCVKELSYRQIKVIKLGRSKDAHAERCFSH